MTLAPIWRNRLFAAGAAVFAVWMSVDLARGEFFWPGFAGALLLLFLVARFQPFPVTTVLLVAATVGYVVGNRGFAQLMLTPGFPLLPAEAVLAVSGSLLLLQSAWRHELPIRRDALNLVLLAWMTIGALRIGFDVRIYGAVALRDFALVYYAAFFFLGQEMAAVAANRRLYLNVLAASCAVVLPAFWLFDRYPEYFFNTLTVRGVPLIFYKGDLAATFIAAGSVLFFLRFEEQRRRVWAAVISIGLAGAVLSMNSRAAILALLVAALWLAIRGRWRFAATLGLGSVVAIVAILVGASALRIPWDKTPVFSIYERVVSIWDPFGEHAYRGAETFNKGDNNLYRSVWWQAVIDETIDGNPYIGLGFGHDLAARFVQEYYPESTEEFTVRSPHNVLLSIFARMGAIGLAAFLGVVALVARRTWDACRAGPAEAAPWCVAWALLTSACLGVVLEGPMGAVVFWTLLGVGNAVALSSREAAAASAAADSESDSDPVVAAAPAAE